MDARITGFFCHPFVLSFLKGGGGWGVEGGKVRLLGGRKKWISDTYGAIQSPKHRHVFPFEIA